MGPYSRIFNFPSIDLTDNYNMSTQAQVVVTCNIRLYVHYSGQKPDSFHFFF